MQSKEVFRGLEPIAGLSDDPHIGLTVDQRNQTLPHHGMVIGNQDRQCAASLAIRARQAALLTIQINTRSAASTTPRFERIVVRAQHFLNSCLCRAGYGCDWSSM